MTKSKGRYKPRDKEETRRLLIAAVSDIIREFGYKGLGVNKVAIRAGVHKKNIYTIFGSYNNLLKTYIRSMDFWAPVFEKFHLSDSPKADEVQDYIREIFQEQFKYFFSEKEMQAFIHWQISEPSPLLRQISEEREAQGAEIAARTSVHFQGTGISMRSVLALILGGIYYIVWHADKNRSVVCGLDINEEKQREELVETIGMVIDWTWEAAARNRNESVNK
jgi:AcrR family transcriptional regulator